MSEYQVIARKWRPQSFGDVVGQQHVVRTLKNAISQNRTAHAYLFVGPRGVGKTTLARIFAKAMNCANPRNGEPCCQCDSCLAIAQDRSLDVLEVDAASRNSTNDMRELSEDVLTRPVGGKYKIYIIDEVHMLSKQAWNVLLKTVEEPPSHVKFIFATTEVHQVLPTIISRCQRFDLLPIPTKLIAERLRLVADTEKVLIRQDAIDAIARAAEGGMRDAQSLLDQMIAFFSHDGDEITGEQVLSLFGLTDRNDLDSLLLGLIDNQPGNVVSIVARLAKRGKNLETLFDDLLNALRIAQLCSILPNPGELLDESEETIRHYQEISRRTMPSVLQTLLEHLAPVGRVLHDALNKQVYLETILLKAIREAHAVTLDAIMMRLNQLRTAGELKFLEQLPPVTAAIPAIQPPPAVSIAPAATQESAPAQEPAPAVSVKTETQTIQQVTAQPETATEQPASPDMTTPAVADRAETSVSEAEVSPAPVQEMQIEVPPAPVQETQIEVPPVPVQEMQIEDIQAAAMPVETPPAPIQEMAVPCAEETFSATETLPPPTVETADESDEKEEAELDISPAVKLTADISGTPAPELSVVPKGDHLRESVINKDASALRTVLNDPDVKTLVDLFDGTVVDIHR